MDSIARNVNTGRFNNTAVPNPAMYRRKTKTEGRCGTNTLTSIATMYPNSRYAQIVCFPVRQLKYVMTQAATVSTRSASRNSPGAAVHGI